MEHGHHRIVVAVASAFDAYQRPIFEGLSRALASGGIHVVAHVEDTRSAHLPPSLRCLLHHPDVAGVVSTSGKSAEQDTALRDLVAARGLPAVYIGQEIPGAACVRANNVAGMGALMELILDGCGARAPVLVQGLAHQPDHIERERVFRAEIHKRGLSVDEGLIFRGHSDLETIKRGLRDLLTRRRDMDALVTMDDSSALAAIEVLQSVGLRVPQDVVVTGFDNYPIAAISWPSLTTVDQALEEQGAAAGRLILRQLDGDRTGELLLTPCTVIRRASTAVGEVDQDGCAQTVESVTRLARAHVTAQGELLRIGRALMRSRTVDDISTALAEVLSALAIPRAFLAVYEPAPDAPHPEEAANPSRCRLLLDYRDGRVQPVPEPEFSTCGVLPPHLAHELHRGLLGLQPLIGSRRLGYLLFEPAPSPVSIVENLQMDLSRTMEAVFGTIELAAHSATLERLVEQRTRELVSEIASRRQAEQELRRANQELRRTMVLDGLTGIANRTALDRHLAEYWPKHTESGQDMAILLVDVDLFKPYNDRYGHLRGDAALRTVATCLSQACRYPHDLACRFGGEEFIAVLPGSGEEEALTVARRFRALLADQAVEHEASPVAGVLTASVGVASAVPRAGMSPEDLIAEADRALYLAKSTGRDRIVVASTGEPVA